MHIRKFEFRIRQYANFGERDIADPNTRTLRRGFGSEIRSADENFRPTVANFDGGLNSGPLTRARPLTSSGSVYHDSEIFSTKSATAPAEENFASYKWLASARCHLARTPVCEPNGINDGQPLTSSANIEKNTPDDRPCAVLNGFNHPRPSISSAKLSKNPGDAGDGLNNCGRSSNFLSARIMRTPLVHDFSTAKIARTFDNSGISRDSSISSRTHRSEVCHG